MGSGDPMSDRLKIAWFTPFHTDSAIGEFSQHVTAELSRFADVEIWTADAEPWLATKLPLVPYDLDSDELDRLPDHDAVVYNMGNYLGYHASIHAVSKRHPGIVILHDRALHHLFAELWLHGPDHDPPRYIDRMRAHYGEDGALAAQGALRGERAPVWESDEDVLRYPLYEEAIVNATAVVTHSAKQARDVRSRWLGPVASLHLPSYRDVVTRALRADRPECGELVRLLSIGHLNPNKQVHRVIEMLASDSEIAPRVEYRVVGTDGGFLAYAQSLEKLVASAADRVSIALQGWLPDEELERELEAADIFVNLRHPNIEGGSASLMRQLAYGRPVLCFDSGYFGELPTGSVARVPVGDFDAAARALRELVKSPERRAEMGARARELAEGLDEQLYVRGLLELIGRSCGARPALRLIDAVGHELGRMGADRRLPVYDDIANDFARILDL